MKNLGVRSNTQDIANLEDIPSLSNIVTTDTVQTISATKTFSKEVAFDNHIRVNGGVGTAGQVLTSQGSNKPPIWKTPSGGSTDKEFYYISGSTASIANMVKDGIYVWTPGSVSTATFQYGPSNSFTITPPNGCVIYILVTKQNDTTSAFYTLCWRFYLGEVLYYGKAYVNKGTGSLYTSLGAPYKLLEKKINEQDFLSSDSIVMLFQANIGGTISWYGDCDIDGDITFTLSDNQATPTKATVTISNYSQGDPIFVNITRNGVYTLMEITTYEGVQRAILTSSYIYESRLKITSPTTGASFTFQAFKSYEKGGRVS